ncbi:L-ascorbate oxidase-like protein [Hordeum vulgare]|nr:L-ascorbate oxidase-like protein [Hordeum vulgare]
MALEFVVKLCGPIRGRLRLHHPFARVMEVDRPPVLWLRAHGCCNGAAQVDVEYPERGVMFLERGWKSFARAHNLMDGHVLRFKMMEADLLSVKIYGRSGARLSCCKQSSSRIESPSSRDSGEEDSDGSDVGDGSELSSSGQSTMTWAQTDRRPQRHRKLTPLPLPDRAALPRDPILPHLPAGS